MQGKLTCKQAGAGEFIYQLVNTKTGAGYLGQSGRKQPTDGFREHKASVEDGTQAVGEYFLKNSAGVEDLKLKRSHHMSGNT